MNTIERHRGLCAQPPCWVVLPNSCAHAQSIHGLRKGEKDGEERDYWCAELGCHLACCVLHGTCTEASRCSDMPVCSS